MPKPSEKSRRKAKQAPTGKRAVSNSGDIGARIRFMRRQRSMSLDRLAGMAGLTKSFLSKIERGLSVPSIATALKVAESFDVSVGQLLGEEQGMESFCVVRKGERRAFMRDRSDGYNYEMLAAGKQLKSMEPFVMRPPFEFQNGRLFDHVGEEFIFVLSGAMEVEFPNRRITLEAGDALYFESHLPHRSRSLGRKPAEALVVVTGRR
jgi:transcriptional regulator with XRE-family HTH domain